MASTFETKLKEAMGEKGYTNLMRRSIQTIILFEAHRIIKDDLRALRPFQRKLAFSDQAKALLAGLDCIPNHGKSSILWRTGASQEVMDPDTAWKRMKMIEKDLERLAAKAKPLCTEGKPLDEVTEEFVQQLYDEVQGSKGNHLIMAYRMYYLGDGLNPDFPPPQAPMHIAVPTRKPDDDGVDTGGGGSHDGDDAAKEEPAEDRMEIIHEIGEHLKLLKEFEGSIPKSALTQKRIALFAALPDAPPSREEREKRQRIVTI